MQRRTETKTSEGRRRADAFADALCDDANSLRAAVSPALERRIEAALARERPLAPPRRPRASLARPWLAGSLAGLAAAAVVMLLLPGRPDTPSPSPSATPDAALTDARSEYLRMLELELPLKAETAVLTAPLEEELRDLKADLDKTRESLQRDLRLTF